LASSATAKNTGISVQKVKPIADLVRGKNVEDALKLLHFMASPVAALVERVVRSAAANAENELATRTSDLRIVEIQAGEGPRTKRFRPRAKGRVGRVTRNNSRITVLVEEEELERG